MSKLYTLLRYLLIFSIIGLDNSYAQIRPAIAWQKCLGGTLEDKANDVLINADGSFIVAGYSKSNDGDVSGHHGSTNTTDAWIVKLDSSGNIIWQRSVGGTGSEYFNTVIAASGGGYLCVGSTDSNDGDVSGNHGAGDVWVVKINNNGTIVWSKCYGGSKADAGSDIVRTSDGAYAIMGTSYSYDGDVLSGANGRIDSDGWAFKINESGNIIWERCINTPFNFLDPVNHHPNDIGYNITTAEDGNLYAFASGTEDYEDGVWPYFDTLTRTPGKLYRLDVTNGSSSFAGSVGGDSSFSMCKGPNAIYFSFVEESYFYVEHCFKEALYLALKANGSSLISRSALAGTSQCIMYGEQLTSFAKTHGIAADISTGYFIGAGMYGRYQDPVNHSALLSIAGLKCYYGGGVNITGYSSNDEFNAVKVYPSGNEYIAVGHTNAVDGDVSGYHGAQGGIFPDCWVVRLQGLNHIVGNVFLDLNSNGLRDAGEPPFNHTSVISSRAGFTQAAIPYTGFYANTVDTGTFITTLSINRPYYTFTPAGKTTVFSSYKNTDTANFAVHAIPGIQDYTIGATSLLPPTPGFNLKYNITYTNNGTVLLVNKNVLFVKDPRTQFLGAVPAYTSISGDTIRWNIASLAPTFSGNIILDLQLDIPPAVNNGDVLMSNVSIESTGDYTPADNYITLNEIVGGSFDPNDKQESFGGEIHPQDISSGKFLNYTIRFQNTGTDTAFNIILRDTLDTKLNVDSIEIVSASHPYTVNIKDGRYLTVKYNNIKLPDSTHNETLSHGYFTYRIKPLSTVVPGDTIKNSASIYFDFNLPVKTNEQLTIIRPFPVTNTWTGAVSTAWENVANWSTNTIPDDNTVVIINTGLTRYPIINSNAVCKTLEAKQGTNVLVKTGFTLKVLH